MLLASTISPSWYRCSQLNYNLVANPVSESYHSNLTGFNYHLIPSLTFQASSHTIQPFYDCAYTLASLNSSRSIEELIVSRAKNIDAINKIYFNERDMLTTIFVIVSMNKYDYELMNVIFDNFEFPIKDMYPNKLISFNYIPLVDLGNRKSFELLQLIYNKELNDIKFETLSNFESYIEPDKSFPEVKWYGFV